jgi:hypothetical protein
LPEHYDEISAGLAIFILELAIARRPEMKTIARAQFVGPTSLGEGKASVQHPDHLPDELVSRSRERD